MTMKDYQRKSPIVIFLGYFRNHWKLFLLDVLCAVCIAGIDLSFPLVTRSALYDMLPGQMYKTFFTVMVIVLLCYVLRSVLTFIVDYFGHTFGIRVEADIRKDLFGHMQTLSFDFYDQNRTGQLMSRLTTDLFDALVEASANAGTDAPTATDAPKATTTVAEEGGCGGVIATTAVVMTSVLALGAAFVAKKKED